jgi:Na+/glutamate symporter
MALAEEQPAAIILAIRTTAADVGEAAMDMLIAVGMVALAWHAIADVPLPVVIVAYCPAHATAPLLLLQVRRYADV